MSNPTITAGLSSAGDHGAPISRLIITLLCTWVAFGRWTMGIRLGWDKAACDWVAMQVAEFFEALFRRKDVEVVIAGEPEGRFGELFGDGTF